MLALERKPTRRNETDIGFVRFKGKDDLAGFIGRLGYVKPDREVGLVGFGVGDLATLVL